MAILLNLGKSTCYHGRPLRLHFGSHFHSMIITSDRLIILHTTYSCTCLFGYKNRHFVTIGWKVISPYTLRQNVGGHLGL